MTQRQALKLATQKWGAKAWTELNRRALVGEARAKVSEELKAHREAKPKHGEPGWREWRDREESLMGEVLRNRCQLGYTISLGGFGIGRAVRGYGDTWEEAWERANRH